MNEESIVEEIKDDPVDVVDTEAGSEQDPQPQNDEPKSNVSISESGNIKIDFSAKQADPVVAEPAIVDDVPLATEDKVVEEITEIVTDDPVVTPVVDKVVADEPVVDNKPVAQEYPENIQKLVQFLEETGGDITDYVRLNTDYSKLDEDVLLAEYYQATNPDLSEDELDFMLEDKFDYDEDVDSEKDIKRKKLSKKEELRKAKSYLEDLKSKYYGDIKAKKGLPQEAKEAVDFYQSYKQKTEAAKAQEEKVKKVFLDKTAQVFSEEFKGFEYNVGDKRYRVNIKEPNKVKDVQSDISNFIGKFLDSNNEMSNAKDYHKALYTAMNPDVVAKHFYEQGKADAIKASIARSKNVDMDPRSVHTSQPQAGWSVRSVNSDGGSGSKLKIKR